MAELEISAHANQKLRAYIDGCKTEISGLGKIKETENGFQLVDVEILKQTVTGATTELDEDALGAFAFELHEQEEDLREWVCWWHSHANMKAFFSGTDIATIKETTEQKYLVSLVGNHAGDWKARLDIYEPAHATAELDVIEQSAVDDREIVKDLEKVERKLSAKYKADIALEYDAQPLIDNEIKKQCESQITQLVKTKTPTHYRKRGKMNREQNTRTIEQTLWGSELEWIADKETELLTPRQVGLITKAETRALTDNECEEIAPLLDTLDKPSL